MSHLLLFLFLLVHPASAKQCRIENRGSVVLLAGWIEAGGINNGSHWEFADGIRLTAGIVKNHAGNPLIILVEDAERETRVVLVVHRRTGTLKATSIVQAPSERITFDLPCETAQKLTVLSVDFMLRHQP